VIPLKVDVRSQTVPLVTVTLIAVNLAVFCYQVSLQLGLDSNALRAADDFVREFGVMPCRLTGRCRLPEEAPPPVLTIFTSMFVHGGVMHLGGNMLYLWVFGHNVEDALGHGRFAIFYLLTGVAAVFGQTLVGPASAIPMVGASGAVSGVLGAYVLLFPRATILTLVTFGFFWRFVHLPAVVVLGLWIGLQVVSGYLTFGLGGGGEGGIAFFAHIGGFLAGMAALFVLRPRGTRRL
jgi:membrane associated rhomboid family serine protease